ncbi:MULTISPECIES: LysR family transcriptional regulator [unclassified Gilliamella]|uniref:LysR family transcriptional regulator n=1 Tax=unclassified Gilliamella TaxID=2685620 RepID=UPI001328D864|nr:MULTISPECIES: LysR family transcriptional regulator [unclassified Gilliamella]MWN31544.1 LysR family transcriptional regulator [Gilliamella sp. Pra-s60]MWP28651.1 LysR family transcriptional regulator [Gilliamella sp. Pra-s54]
MDLFRSMEAFVLTVKTGSFASASISLNTSPQMVAKYILFLETQLGLKLLNRTTRSQNLTEFGKQYYERCLSILGEVKATTMLAQQFLDEPSGVLRISAPFTFGNSALVSLISRFLNCYPKISVDIQLSDHYVDLVKDGFDIAFRIGDLSDSSLIARRLNPHQLIFAASPNYLAEYGIPLTPYDLKQHRCLVYQYANQNSKDYIWPFMINGELINIPISGSFQSNQTSALAIAAIEGLGITMLPEAMLQEPIKQKKLLPVLQSFLPPAKQLNMLYTADCQQLPKLKAFIEFVLNAMA